MPPRDPQTEIQAQARRTGTCTHQDAGEVLRRQKILPQARFHPASHPNQGQLDQESPETTTGRSPKARRCQAPREARNRPSYEQDRMAARHFRRRRRTWQGEFIQRTSALSNLQTKVSWKPPWTTPEHWTSPDRALIIRNSRDQRMVERRVRAARFPATKEPSTSPPSPR